MARFFSITILTMFIIKIQASNYTSTIMTTGERSPSSTEVDHDGRRISRTDQGTKVWDTEVRFLHTQQGWDTGKQQCNPSSRMLPSPEPPSNPGARLKGKGYPPNDRLTLWHSGEGVHRGYQIKANQTKNGWKRTYTYPNCTDTTSGVERANTEWTSASRASHTIQRDRPISEIAQKEGDKLTYIVHTKNVIHALFDMWKLIDNDRNYSLSPYLSLNHVQELRYSMESASLKTGSSPPLGLVVISAACASSSHREVNGYFSSFIPSSYSVQKKTEK